MGYSIYATNTLIVSIVFPILAIAAVALRVAARHKKSIPLRWDDGAIALALAIAVTSGAICIYGAVDGEIGRPIPTLAPSAGIILFKLLFAIILLHLCALTFIKISILLFYKRIFVTPRFLSVANATMIFVIIWWLTFFIGLFFASTPISNFWTKHETDLNYDVGAFFMVLAALDLVVDLWTLCLPLPVIARLNMQSKQKWQLIAIFWLGFFCVVSSAVRLYYIYAVITLPGFTDSSFLYVLSNNFIWAVIEPCVSIVAACLPTFAPLVTGWRWPESLVRSVRSILSIHSGDSQNSRRTRHGQQTDNIIGHGRDENAGSIAHQPQSPSSKRSLENLVAKTTRSESIGGDNIELEDLGEDRRTLGATETGIRVDRSVLVESERRDQVEGRN